MSLRKNQADQRFTVFAFDRTNNVPVTGDAANITAKIRKDYGTPAATNDVNPTEIEDGYYDFLAATAETNADVIDVFPESSTADVQVIGVPAKIFTVPAAAGFVFGGAALTTRELMELMFGEDNVEKWADLDNESNAATISARIDQAANFATEESYDWLRGGPFEVPLADVSAAPLTLVDAATRLAGVWLYENRGVNDATKEKKGTHRLTYHRDYAEKFFKQVRSGQRRLYISGVTQAVAHPAAVHDVSTSYPPKRNPVTPTVEFS